MTKGYDIRKESNKKYLATLDELKIRIPKGRKTDVEAHAKAKGQSVNGLVNALLRADMGLSEEEWKKADAPAGEPIVSNETYEQAQAAMKHRNKGTEKKAD